MCVKGLLLGVTGGVRLSYCKKTLNVDGSQCQLMGAVAATPWAIKGAIGVLSDAYPLLGYHKASYIMVSSLIGSVAFALLAGVVHCFKRPHYFQRPCEGPITFKGPVKAPLLSKAP